jgi:Holliday junction resolvase
MVRSRAKGAAGERELAETLRGMGYTSRRTQQYCGAAEGDSDVVAAELPSVHIECKRVERLNIEEAMEQAARDAAKRSHIPSVWHRKNGGEWMVTVRLADLHRFAHAIDTAKRGTP